MATESAMAAKQPQMTERAEGVFLNPFKPGDITTVSQKDLSRLGGKLLAAPPTSSRLAIQRKIVSKKSPAVRKIVLRPRAPLQHDVQQAVGVKDNKT